MIRSNSMVSYEDLKQTAFNAGISTFALEELKKLYKTQIASTRRLNCIKTIQEFIDVLERRDALSEHNIEFLHKLMSYCQSTNLRDALCYYCTPPKSESMPYDDRHHHQQQRLGNEYRDNRLAENLQESLRLTRNYTSSIGNNENFHGCSITRVPAATTTVSFVGILTDDKRRAIYKKLCKELGRDWRNFGRELKICEGDIDNIESQSNDLSIRITKLLRMFEEDECNNPKEHCLLICYALDCCQRKDLRRAIEKIMSY